eukprot:TRINITY_DN62648_c0_g1_i1.p1 TRINITY_DN62648_c0_g1~~TRINITY_DN62648_c0_g1_i1.p1  ORF type:complete len:461 (+),score=65.57 TRINITY_DN62648_c0_g1_i1:24-1385(+)
MTAPAASTVRVGSSGQSPHEEFDVVIIGAGVAGLSCAAALREISCGSVLRVAVLEAGGRVGGRACTVEINGHVVDVGAGWIHGVQGNPLVERGIISRDDFVECSVGNIWTMGPQPGDSSNFHPSAEDLERWNKRLASCADDAADTRSLVDTLRSGGENWSVADERFLRAFELWFGAEADELSAVEWSPGACLGDFPGPHAVVRGGMPLVAERILERAGGVSAVTLGATVEAIEEDDTGVTLRIVAGSSCGFDIVRTRLAVCTVPLGALQQGYPSISPPLPQSVSGALQRLRMSGYCKCIILLDQSVASRFPVWTWTDHALFPMAFNYHSVKGVPLVACTSVSRTLANLDDDEVVAQASTALGLSTADVTAFHVTRWSAVDWSVGAYSFSAVGCDFCEVDQLCDGLEGRRLILAGEHMSDDHQGALHGAYLSGRKVAEDVMARLGGQPIRKSET